MWMADFNSIWFVSFTLVSAALMLHEQNLTIMFSSIIWDHFSESILSFNGIKKNWPSVQKVTVIYLHFISHLQIVHTICKCPHLFYEILFYLLLLLF